MTRCPSCHAEIAASASFCLTCGERCRPSALDWRDVTGRDQAGAASPPEAERSGLPSARASATILLGAVGFGLLAATATAGRVPDALPPIVVQMPAAVAVAGPPPKLTTAATATPPPISHPGTPTVPAAAAPAEVPSRSNVPPQPSDAPSTSVGETTPRADPQRSTTSSLPATPIVPPIEHVWVVIVHGTPFDAGDHTQTPFLSTELPRRGVLLSGYAPPSDDPATTGVTLLSGRAEPTTRIGPDTPTIATRLTEAGLSWKVYVDGRDSAVADGPCASPADTAPLAPLALFPSIANADDCASHVAPLTSLAEDARDETDAPAFSLIVADGAHDGRDPAAADAVLRDTLTALLSSRAYAHGGLILVLPTGATVDAAPVTPTTTPDAVAPTATTTTPDASSTDVATTTSAEPAPSPATTASTTTAPSTAPRPAAGSPPARTGALLLSPFAAGGDIVDDATDTLSILRTIESAFRLKPLGPAASRRVPPLGARAFARWTTTGSRR